MSKTAQAILSVFIGAAVAIVVTPWVVKATFAYANWVMAL